MRIRIEQLNPVIGDLEGNTDAILAAWTRASQDGIDLLVLPEMAVPGYPPMDLLDQPHFIDGIEACNRRIRQADHGSTALLFGTVTRHGGLGHGLHNSAMLVCGGRLAGLTHKRLLPTYDVFDDLRYFDPGPEASCMHLGGRSLGVLICEDFFHNMNEPPAPMYDIEPARDLRAQGAEILIVLSASPFTQRKHEIRMELMRRNSEAFGVPVLYVNQVGANTELVFDGDSIACSENGELVAACGGFREAFADVDLGADGGLTRMLPADGVPGSVMPGSGVPGSADPVADPYPSDPIERVFETLTLGIRDFLAKSAFGGRLLVGLSGGIDSAVVATLCAAAWGPDRVTVIGLPSRFSSGGSLADSKRLASNLGLEWAEIPIEPAFEAFLRTLSPFMTGPDAILASSTGENLQSRIRGVMLMAWSNRFGHLLMSTGNKSEMSVGYATLYGDMNGALAPIGDLYKTDVYALARWLNERGPYPGAIPQDILSKAPSAELRPDQKDSDSLPDYEVLDDILRRYIDDHQSPEAIISGSAAMPDEVGSAPDPGTTADGSIHHDPDVVHDVIRRVHAAEFKRWQAPPILKVHGKAFGTGRRWPLVFRRPLPGSP